MKSRSRTSAMAAIRTFPIDLAQNLLGYLLGSEAHGLPPLGDASAKASITMSGRNLINRPTLMKGMALRWQRFAMVRGLQPISCAIVLWFTS